MCITHTNCSFKFLFFVCFFSSLLVSEHTNYSDRMSASECLEHKWLCDGVQPTQIKCPMQTTQTETINKIESHANNTNHIDIINKVRNNDVISTIQPPSSSSLPPLPPKPTAGFYLHQNVNCKNATTIDDRMFNNKFNMLTRTSLHTNNNGEHLTMQTTLPHHPLTISNGEFHTKDIECLKPTIVGSCSQSEKSELLKDYAINKENINLSTILVNRTNSSTMPAYNEESLDVSRLSNGNGSTSTLTVQQTIMNLPANNPNIANATNTTIATTTTTAAATSQATKIETILFPDAPTTPKVSRKSAIDGDIDTPACVTLVKQFQLNGNNLATRIDYDLTAADSLATYKSSTSTRNNKFSSNDHTHDIPSSYRLTATAMTRSVFFTFLCVRGANAVISL